MILRTLISIAIIAVCTSCGTEAVKPVDVSATPAPTKKINKQINISILWDLSDRISPATHHNLPSSAEKDIAIIKHFADLLKADMDAKGAFMAKGKLKVFFSPAPNDPQINSLAKKLDIDLSTADVQTKKTIYDNVSSDFEITARTITDQTIKTSTWNGSDIYRFFKNDVNDYCVAKDTTARNILVVLTDGYIYHPQSKGKIANQSEFILPSLLSSLGLRNNPDFKNVISAKNCGLITPRTDLENLEVLVLEVNSEENFKNDEDVIKAYLQKWFTSMNAKRFEIYNTDLTDNTKKRINNFINDSEK